MNSAKRPRPEGERVSKTLMDYVMKVAERQPAEVVDADEDPIPKVDLATLSDQKEPKLLDSADAPGPALVEASLSEEQRQAFNLAVRDRKSVFITGGAGTGKSYLLRTIVKELKKDFCGTVYVTATTGMAALNIGGCTVHSFAGCGLVDRTTKFNNIKRFLRKKNWIACKTLIIDEVSMLDAHFFNLLDQMGRYVIQRKSYLPFGGIQLILSGDFLQLPPVEKSRQKVEEDLPLYCFESQAWYDLNPVLCMLTKPFRQKNEEFFSLLNKARYGDLDFSALALLQSRTMSNTVHFVQRVSCEEAVRHRNDGCCVVSASASLCKSESSVKDEDAERTPTSPSAFVLTNEKGVREKKEFDGYTKLRSTLREVDDVNLRYYSALPMPEYDYKAYHRPPDRRTPGPFVELLHLRKGCRVMLVKNVDLTLGLVNGTTGVVTGFANYTLGYKFKSALSSIAGVVGVGTNTDSKAVHHMLPVVKFTVVRNNSSPRDYEVVVEPQEWTEMCGEELLSSTVQMPLIQAYAITIHKAQGMSLSQVDIDLKSVFAAGQAYVALSRCTNMETMQLYNFRPDVVLQDSRALAYYRAAQMCMEDGRIAQEDLTRRVDQLRRRILDLQEQADTIKLRVKRSITPFTSNKNTRIVMDLTSLFDLVKDPFTSKEKYDTVFGFAYTIVEVGAEPQQEKTTTMRVSSSGENMIRIPRVVFDFIEQVAAVEPFTATPAVPLVEEGEEREKSHAHDDAETVRQEGNSSSSEEAPMSEGTTGSMVARELSELIQKAMACYVLDVQRVTGETQETWPAPLEAWCSLGRLLPLLQRNRAVAAFEEAATMTETEGFLNGDRREREMHEGILSYAFFLRERYGEYSNTVICTENFELAATALAYGFPITSVNVLASE